MSNTRKLRLIIERSKLVSKLGKKGCNCGGSRQYEATPVTEIKTENNKNEEIKKQTINNNTLKFL